MIRWLRVSWPPLGWIVGFAIFYGSALGFLHWATWRFGGPLLDEAGRPLLHLMTGGTLLIGVGIYSFWRAFVFHPRGRTDYAAWLATTPWTSKKPLPLGPVQLVPQDILFIGMIVALTWLGGAEWALLAPQLFLALYSALVACTFFTTGAWPWGYAVLFAVGVTVRLWLFIPASLGAALLAYLFAYLGLRQALARFPWKESWLDQQLAFSRKNNYHHASGAIGWPYARLAPKFPGSETCIAVHHALLLSALIGWAIHAALALAPHPADQDEGSRIFLSFVLTIAPVVRCFVYCNGYLPPISFLGRLATLRWIIPGYDRILVAPLLALLVGGALEVAGKLLGADPLYARPVNIAVILAICLGMGPTLKTWRLTGEHRIAITTLRTETVRVG